MSRVKEFDVDTVLLKALHLFWEQGYEKTSINDLVETMGIHRRSLYDTFGDKHQLFLRAVERYGKLLNGHFQAGIDRSNSTKEAIRFMFNYLIDGYDTKPPGCLYVNMAVELASRDEEVDLKAGEGFKSMEQLLTDLIQKGQSNGEFTISRKAEELAENLFTTSLGLRVLVRTSADKQKLHRIADAAMALLEP